jgi:hypothetical protein
VRPVLITGHLIWQQRKDKRSRTTEFGKKEHHLTHTGFGSNALDHVPFFVASPANGE